MLLPRSPPPTAALVRTGCQPEQCGSGPSSSSSSKNRPASSTGGRYPSLCRRPSRHARSPTNGVCCDGGGAPPRNLRHLGAASLLHRPSSYRTSSWLRNKRDGGDVPVFLLLSVEMIIYWKKISSYLLSAWFFIFISHIQYSLKSV